MLKKIFLLLLAATTILVVVHYLSLPDPMSKLKVPYQFQIYRDDNWIPRVVAKDKKSMFFAIGFAQGQDRLWALKLRKMIVQGRASELFGSEVLPLDLEMRNYAFSKVGKMNAKHLPDEQRQWLQSFVQGINSYAKIQNYLPLQFYLTWTKWEDWTIQTPLSCLALTSFILEFDWMYQIARQRLLQTVGFDLAWKMMPFGELNLFREVTIVNNEELKQMGRFKQYNSSNIENILRKHWVNKTLPIGSVNLPYTDYQTLGSNAWVISGEHTENGRPLLANDPHVGLIAPSFFYALEVILLEKNSSEINTQAFGAMIDGFPGISMGQNGIFGWGSTASYVDNKDVFHQKVRDNNGTLQYYFNEQWRQFEIRKEVFKVRGSQQVVKNYYHTHRGPVIENLFMDLHYKYGYPIPTQYRVNHTLTLSSAIYFPDNSSTQGLLGLVFSKNIEQFTYYSSKIQCPNIDSAFITNQGLWGYGPIGRIPKRNVPEMGSFIKDGTTDFYDMKGFVESKDYINLLSPKKGYISMANNKYADDGLDDRSSVHEITTGRAYRLEKFITQKIQNKQKFNFTTMKQMQLDNKDEFLSEAFPLLLDGLEKVRYIWSNKVTEQIFHKLRTWDYHMPINSVEASIYHIFQHHFHETLIKSTSLSAQERQAILNHAFFEVYILKLYENIGKDLLSEEQKIVCNNQFTNNYTDIHPCITNAALTFKELPKLLEEVFKTKDINAYEWGKIHKHTYKSVPFSEIPILKSIWGRQTPAAGNSRTLDVGILSHQTKSYNSIGGPVFRLITDLNRTIFSLDLGVSGNFYSKYYDNFLGKNKYVEYVPKNPLKENVTELTLVTRNLM